MEFDADLDIADSAGWKAQDWASCSGNPATTAILLRWQRKRLGETRKFEEKSCDACRQMSVRLKACSRCKTTRYCSSQCQKSHWKAHKLICREADCSNTVTVKPLYNGLYTHAFLKYEIGIRTLVSGSPENMPPNLHKQIEIATPKVPTKFPKNMVVKVQPFIMPIPDMGTGGALYKHLVIYTRKKDFVCEIGQEDPDAYEALLAAVIQNGAPVKFPLKGTRIAYFTAELKSADELVVKIGEPLAEQPF